jgi:hypothetical protein
MNREIRIPPYLTGLESLKFDMQMAFLVGFFQLQKLNGVVGFGLLEAKGFANRFG